METGLDGESGVGGDGSGDDFCEASAWVDDSGRIDDQRVVGLAAAGHGGVGVVACRGLEHGDADVDGVTLGAVAGDGPAELDVAAT